MELSDFFFLTNYFFILFLKLVINSSFALKREICSSSEKCLYYILRLYQGEREVQLALPEIKI